MKGRDLPVDSEESIFAGPAPTDGELLEAILLIRDASPDHWRGIYRGAVSSLGQHHADRLLRPVVTCYCGARVRLVLENPARGRCGLCRRELEPPPRPRPPA